MPLNIDWQQILLHMFNLVLLFGILYFLLYKPVHDFMDKRTAAYKDMDDKKNADMAEAARIKSEYEAKLADANKEASDIRAKAVQSAEDERERIIAKAQTEAGDIVEEARVKARKERDHMLHEEKEELSQLVAEAAGKIALDNNDGGMFESFFAAVEKDDKNA